MCLKLLIQITSHVIIILCIIILLSLNNFKVVGDSLPTGVDGSGTSTPDGDPSVEIQQREKDMGKYKGLLQLVGTYWVLAVMGAFLLVFLSGEPGLLKTVYLIFFFYLILTYQVWYIT